MADIPAITSFATPVAYTTQSQSLPPLIFFNASQLALQLTPISYPSWCAQIHAIFFGHDFLGYIDGSRPCSPITDA